MGSWERGKKIQHNCPVRGTGEVKIKKGGEEGKEERRKKTDKGTLRSSRTFH